MPRARINGIETSYTVTGAGTPVLYIHGGYGGAPTSLVPQLVIEQGLLPAESAQTITYDRRCAGQSEYTLAWFSLADLAADAAALLDHLGHRRAVIVGSSAGGPIALQFALTYPDRTIALCLPNTGANLASPDRPVGRERRALVEAVRERGDAPVFAEKKAELRKPAPLAAMPDDPDLRARTEARQSQLEVALREVSDEDLARYFAGEVRNYHAYLDVDLSPRLGEITCPVCIIHGDADTTVPHAWGEAIHHAIAGSEFHTIPGGAHGILRWPGGAAALRDWLSRVPVTV